MADPDPPWWEKLFTLTLFGWAIAGGLAIGGIIFLAIEFGEEITL